MGKNLLIVLLFCTFVAGCTGLEQIQPEAHVSTFKKLYPKSSHAEWERENGLIKVEFRDGRYEKESWFLTDGTWIRTVTEIPYHEVPAAVVTAIQNRLGNGWTIDDIDLVEQKDDPTRYYLAECEKRIGETDIYIKLAEDGSFLNENEWKMFVGEQQGNNDGNNPNNGNSQGSPLASFTAMFPNAWDVEWENEHGMAKVEFKIGYHEKEAWFLTDGTWVKTVTEIPLSEVPAAVIGALKNRLGNAWQIDDIDLIEQKDAPTLFYLAECEKRIGETDIYIKLAEDGSFLNENEWKMFVGEQQGNNGGSNPDNGNSQGTPLASFTAMFPNAWDIEWENEHGMAKVEFKVGNREKEAWFLTDGTWVRTVTEIPRSEVPAAVVTAILNRLGNGWTIDDIDLVEQKDDPTRYYLAECEKRIGETDIYIKLAEDGSFLNENEWKMFVEEQQGNNGGNNGGNNQNNGNNGNNGSSGNGGNSQGSPLASFTAMFPNAWDVEWENEHGMVKVEFKIGYREKEAWFLADGTWVKTVTEIPLSEVPAAVINALKNRLGNAWQIDDIDLVEQKDAPTLFYLAECEKRGGKQEIHLRVTPDGTIL